MGRISTPPAVPPRNEAERKIDAEFYARRGRLTEREISELLRRRTREGRIAGLVLAAIAVGLIVAGLWAGGWA